MSKSIKEKKQKTNNKANKKIKPKYFDIGNWKTILFIFLCVLVVWTFGSLIVYNRYLNGQEHAGQLGDSYGWLTSLFTALAFAGLLYTILLQRKELKETKEEFKKQNTTLTRQRFETTFFNMLSFHFKIMESVQYKAEGIRAFTQLILFQKTYKQNFRDADRSAIKTNYDLAYKGVAQHTSAYLLSVVQIHRIVKQYTTIDDVKNRYFDIFKYYLSQEERIFICNHILLSYAYKVESLLEIENDLQLYQGLVDEGLLEVDFIDMMSEEQ